MIQDADKFFIIVYLLGNDVSWTKNWKRKPANSPVPNTAIYATTAITKKKKKKKVSNPIR